MKLVRCAVYTRKSSEEGLEQSFNSLDAQREACEAYVLSQKHEGWQVVPSRYDDRGFSGGTMERPGLKQLLADITAGKIDTVVVYKVDRLTRALADFAKIVENFDSKGVSFVSVTQQFNTTTSMGRLTLNVLLSFAQFEREVTGERIRDKVAASKRKGMWMGGPVPLGYDLGKRELVVNEQEAEQVREIYRQYLRLKSVYDLHEYLKTTEIRSKHRIASTGRVLGGYVLSRGTLYYLLSNELYLGKTVHKDKVHQGLHQPIVPQALWDKVARQLKSARVNRRHPRNTPSKRLLTGLLFTESGERYAPTHSNKKGRRYFYYTCKGKNRSIPRLPATVIEDVVLARLRQFLSEPLALRDAYNQLPVSELRALVEAGQRIAHQLHARESKETRTLLAEVLSRVTVAQTTARLEVRVVALAERLLGRSLDPGSPLTLECALPVTKRGDAVRLVLEPSSSTQQVSLVVRTVARAQDWADHIAAGEIRSLAQLVEATQLSDRYVRRTLRCAALSPKLVQAIVDGEYVSDKKAWELASNLSLHWDQQVLRL